MKIDRMLIAVLLFTGVSAIASAGQGDTAPASTLPASAPSGVDRQAIEPWLDQAQAQIDHARQQLKGSSQASTVAPSLDLAEQSIALTRKLLANNSSSRPDRDEILRFLDKAQQRLDQLKTQIPAAANSNVLRLQLQMSQQRLDAARQRLLEQPNPASGQQAASLDIDAIYANAQRRLDDARATAKTLPDAQAKPLLAQLDAAQHRLDVVHKRILSEAAASQSNE